MINWKPENGETVLVMYGNGDTEVVRHDSEYCGDYEMGLLAPNTDEGLAYLKAWRQEIIQMVKAKRNEHWSEDGMVFKRTTPRGVEVFHCVKPNVLEGAKYLGVVL